MKEKDTFGRIVHDAIIDEGYVEFDAPAKVTDIKITKYYPKECSWNHLGRVTRCKGWITIQFECGKEFNLFVEDSGMIEVLKHYEEQAIKNRIETLEGELKSLKERLE